MFTIQYTHPVTKGSALLTLDTRNRARLIWHLARFDHEILAVYEQGTPVTKRTRAHLADAAFSGTVTLNKVAKDFVEAGMRAMTPA